MIETYRLLTIRCENADDETEHFEGCWEETVLKIENEENKDHAIELLVEMGWKTIISEGEEGELTDYHFCPYCNIGVTVEEYEEKIKKDLAPHLERVK